MAARPIDLQTTVPKTQQLARIRQVENNMHRNNMHHQAINDNNQIQKKLNRVSSSEKMDYKKINKDSQNNKDRKFNQSKKKKNEQNCDKNENNKKDNIILGRNIDIKI